MKYTLLVPVTAEWWRLFIDAPLDTCLSAHAFTLWLRLQDGREPYVEGFRMLDRVLYIYIDTEAMTEAA